MEPLDKTKKEGKEEEKVVHKFDTKTSFFSGKYIIILVIALLLGVGTGYLFANKSGTSGGLKLSNVLSSSPKGTTVGSSDTSTFKDTAEGTLKEGGIDGEGAFHLERSGGDSQNVYLTSSIVDLSKYVNQKIKVWGQTQKAQHAGWLMDVGRIQVL